MSAELLNIILWICVTLFGVFLLILSIICAAKERAYKTNPVGYKTGMAVCTKTNKLVALRTPIYEDPKHGGTYMGLQQRFTEGRWV